MIQFVSALCIVSIVVIGLLVMARLISGEQAVAAMVKVLTLFVLLLWAICVLESFLPPALSAFKKLLAALAMVGTAFATILILAIAVLALGKRAPKKCDNRGDEV